MSLCKTVCCVKLYIVSSLLLCTDGTIEIITSPKSHKDASFTMKILALDGIFQGYSHSTTCLVMGEYWLFSPRYRHVSYTGQSRVIFAGWQI